MREELLNIIRCPACGAYKEKPFSLDKEEVNAQEVRKGRVICNACRKQFSIKDGVLDLLYNLDPEILEEIEGNIRAAADPNPRHTDAVLLALPESAESEDPLDATYGYYLNFYKVQDELAITGQELVLDLGSGTTWSANKFVQKGCDCVALDVSLPKFKGLESADSFFKHDSVYYDRVLSDMKNLPFRNASFDIVMTNSSIHHTADLKSVLKEVNRVLKNKGRLTLINEAVCSIFTIKRDKRRKALPGFVSDFHWNENTYSVIQYMRYLRASGFKTRIFYPPSLDKKLLALKKGKLNFDHKGIKHRLA